VAEPGGTDPPARTGADIEIGRSRVAAGIARWAPVAVGLVLAYLVLLWVDAGPRGHLVTGDTNVLIAGTRKAVDCIDRGIWRSCDRAGPGGGTVAPFPLLQYLPAYVMVKLGMSDPAILRVLGRINLVAFGTTMLLAVVALRAGASDVRRWLGALAVAALLGSSATYQATSGFGEMLAACAVLAAVTAAAWRRPLLAAPAVAVACLGKETLFPFLVVLAVLVARRAGERLPPRRLLVSIGAGALVGVAVSALFNEFRYGTIRNGAYLDPLGRTPGLVRKLEFAAGGWFSPSAGIAFFWPGATILLLGVAVLGLVALAARRPWRRWLPPLLSVGVAVAMVGGLALWYAPFGWLAYGPRLAVPLLPAIVVVALSTGAPLVARGIQAVFGRRVRPVAGAVPARGVRVVPLAVAALLFAAAGWPQYGAPWSWRASIEELIAKDPHCPGIMQVRIDVDRAAYFRCISDVMWRLHPATLDDAALRGEGSVAAGRAMAAAASFALVAAALAAIATGPRGSADLAEPDRRTVGSGRRRKGATEPFDVERE
jgi:hypothetical protein